MTASNVGSSTPNFLRIMGKVLKQPQYLDDEQNYLSFMVLTNDGMKLNIITNEKISFFIKKDNYVLVEAEFTFSSDEPATLDCILQNIWPISEDLYFTEKIDEESNEKEDSKEKEKKPQKTKNIKKPSNQEVHIKEEDEAYNTQPSETSTQENVGPQVETKMTVIETAEQVANFTLADIQNKLS